MGEGWSSKRGYGVFTFLEVCSVESFLQPVKRHSYPTLIMLKTAQHLQIFSWDYLCQISLCLVSTNSEPSKDYNYWKGVPWTNHNLYFCSFYWTINSLFLIFGYRAPGRKSTVTWSDIATNLVFNVINSPFKHPGVASSYFFKISSKSFTFLLIYIHACQ